MWYGFAMREAIGCFILVVLFVAAYLFMHSCTLFTYMYVHIVKTFKYPKGQLYGQVVLKWRSTKSSIF